MISKSVYGNCAARCVVLGVAVLAVTALLFAPRSTSAQMVYSGGDGGDGGLWVEATVAIALGVGSGLGAVASGIAVLPESEQTHAWLIASGIFTIMASAGLIGAGIWLGFEMDETSVGAIPAIVAGASGARLGTFDLVFARDDPIRLEVVGTALIVHGAVNLACAVATGVASAALGGDEYGLIGTIAFGVLGTSMVILGAAARARYRRERETSIVVAPTALRGAGGNAVPGVVVGGAF